jgi:hypothetical protein
MDLYKSFFGLYSLAETPQLPPPPAFGLIYEGAIGQPRYTTSLCNPLVIMIVNKETNNLNGGADDSSSLARNTDSGWDLMNPDPQNSSLNQEPLTILVCSYCNSKSVLRNRDPVLF